MVKLPSKVFGQNLCLMIAMIQELNRIMVQGVELVRDLKLESIFMIRVESVKDLRVESGL